MLKIIDIFLIKIIKIYQKTFSPDHSWLKKKYPYGFCRFYPTCSEYAVKSINKHGSIKAAPKIIWRLLRCNPFNKGGVDLP